MFSSSSPSTSRHALAVTACALIAVASLGARQTPTVAQVMERVGRYVTGYSEQLPLLVATEHYSQWKEDEDGTARPWHRTLISDFVLVRLGAGDDWVAYRDAYQLDDKRLSADTTRLRALFLTGGEQAGSPSAKKFTSESAAYNMAPIARNFNTPTTALFFARPVNQPRFEFRKTGEETIDGLKVWRIKYKETRRPTLFRGANGADMPVEGSLWVTPDDGRVVRTHMEIALRSARTVNKNDSLASVATSYRADPKDGVLLPAEMKETYEFLEVRNLGNKDARAKVNCTATYTDVQRPKPPSS